MEILQLWMNLPAVFKMSQPNYQGLQENEIPKVISEDTKTEVAIISGNLEGKTGAAQSLTGLEMFNIQMKEGGEYSFKIEEGKNVLFYVIDGEVLVNGKLVIGHQLTVFNTKNTDIELKAQSATRIIFGTGDPINEPMVSQGPFVMNTTTELMQAMRDYQMGKMGVM